MTIEADDFRPPEAAVGDRMSGDVGYDTVRPLLPADVGWFDLRRARWTDPRAGIGETNREFDLWLDDLCPLRPGQHYAAYFFELDAWSEYWDVYHPETCGLYHFGDGELEGYLSAFLPGPNNPRAPVFDAWKAYALASRDPQSEPDATQVARLVTVRATCKPGAAGTYPSARKGLTRNWRRSP